MWSTLYCMMMSSQPMGMSKGGALGGFSLVVGWSDRLLVCGNTDEN